MLFFIHIGLRLFILFFALVWLFYQSLSSLFSAPKFHFFLTLLRFDGIIWHSHYTERRPANNTQHTHARKKKYVDFRLLSPISSLNFELAIITHNAFLYMFGFICDLLVLAKIFPASAAQMVAVKPFGVQGELRRLNNEIN